MFRLGGPIGPLFETRRLYHQAARDTIEATLVMEAEVRVASRVTVTSIPIDHTAVDTASIGASLLVQSPLRRLPHVLVSLDRATERAS